MLLHVKSLALTLLAMQQGSAVGFAAGYDRSRGSMEGRMLDNDGAPLARAIVRAERSERPGVLLRTDEEGYYCLTGLYAGEWRVESLDQAGWQVTFETCMVEPDETATLDFTAGEDPLPDDFVRTQLVNTPTG